MTHLLDFPGDLLLDDVVAKILQHVQIVPTGFAGACDSVGEMAVNFVFK